MHANLAYLKETLVAGATGYVLKTSAREELAGALRDVIRNRIYVSSGFGEEFVGGFERSPGSLPVPNPFSLSASGRFLYSLAEGRTARRSLAP